MTYSKALPRQGGAAVNCLHCGLQMPDDYVRSPRCHMPTDPNMPLTGALRDRDIADMAHIARTRHLVA